jgi:hypothetical protein
MPNDTQPKYPIDLGKSTKDLGVPVPSVGEKVPETVYPSLYLEWEKPYGFPDEGEMTVKFKKRSEETRKKSDGKMQQRVELDILSILDTEPAEASDTGEDEGDESTGDVLDNEVKKLSKKKKGVNEGDTQDEGY